MKIIDTLNFIVNHPLNKSKKLDAIFRYIKWQIGGRLTPGTTVFQWINGAKFFVEPGDAGLTGNIYTGLHEFTDMSLLLHVIREGDLFVDVGANVGSYTILACAALKARAFAFEPIPETYRKLEENIRLNHIEDSVESFNIGLGAVDGELSFTSNMNCMNHALSDHEIDSEAIIVQISTMDSMLKHELPIAIKIDVEGFETSVLHGSDLVLSKSSLKIVIMELNGSGSRYGFDEDLIIKLMEKKGFNTYSYSPFDRTFTSLNGKNCKSGNTIFIRDINFVESRVKNSELFTVNGIAY